MKRYVKSTEDVFGMFKIRTKHCLPELKPLIPTFIYVSSKEASHGPRVKFAGGTAKSNGKFTCPSMSFDKEGNCKLELHSYMTPKEYPNCYDSDVLNRVEAFIKKSLPILLLMWFEVVDESTCYNYLQGIDPLSDVIEELGAPSSITTLQQLDVYCREHNLYTAQNKEK